MAQRPSFEDLPLHELSNQPTGTSYFSNAGSSDTPDGHAGRMKEFMNRPATPPPFPEDLPSRPAKKPINRWMLVSFILLAALLGTVMPLAILLGLAQHETKAAQSLPPMAAQAPATTAVTTMMHTTTATFTSNVTVTSAETFTFPEISYVTATITAAPQSTGIISDPETCKNSNDPLILARNFCVMIKTCNEAELDVKENDCKGFCKAAVCTGGGAVVLEPLTPMIRGCCEHCGCFNKAMTSGL